MYLLRVWRVHELSQEADDASRRRYVSNRHRNCKVDGVFPKHCVSSHVPVHIRSSKVEVDVLGTSVCCKIGRYKSYSPNLHSIRPVT